MGGENTGRLKVETLEDVGYGPTLSGYKPNDLDEGSDPKYYGFTDKDGRWYIIRHNVAAEQIRWVQGTSGYVTAFANRASQSYNYFYAVF